MRVLIDIDNAAEPTEVMQALKQAFERDYETPVDSLPYKVTKVRLSCLDDSSAMFGEPHEVVLTSQQICRSVMSQFHYAGMSVEHQITPSRERDRYLLPLAAQLLRAVEGIFGHSGISEETFSQVEKAVLEKRANGEAVPNVATLRTLRECMEAVASEITKRDKEN